LTHNATSPYTFHPTKGILIIPRRNLRVFAKKNAKLSFGMIHNWAEDMVIRPRSVARVEEGGLFLNNYICRKPVRSLQMYPTTHLVGKGAAERWTAPQLKAEIDRAIEESDKDMM